MVNRVFEVLIGKILKAYIDDIMMKGQDFEDHMQNLRAVSESLRT